MINKSREELMKEADELIESTIRGDLKAIPTSHAATRTHVLDMLAKAPRHAPGMAGGASAGAGSAIVTKTIITVVAGLGLATGGYFALRSADAPRPVTPAAVTSPAPAIREQTPPAAPEQTRPAVQEAPSQAMPAETIPQKTETPRAAQSPTAPRAAKGTQPRDHAPTRSATQPAATAPQPSSTPSATQPAAQRPRRVISKDGVPLDIKVPPKN